MGVYKNNKSNLWEWVEIIDGNQVRRRSKKWKNKKDAQKSLEEFKNSIKTTKSIKFDDVCQEYLSYVKLKNKSSTYMKAQSTINAHLLGVFNKNIDQITFKDITDFQINLMEKKYLNNGNETLYRNRTLAIIQEQLRSVLEFANKNEYTDSNIFNKTYIMQRKEVEFKKEMTILTKEQFDSFLNVVDDITYKALFSTLYWCGLRSGEALALTTKDYDRKRKVLDIHKNYDPKARIITTTKTGEIRKVSVPDQCAVILENLIDSYSKSSKNSDYILFGYTTRLNSSQMRRVKNKYIDKANLENELLDIPVIPYFTFHELRHTHVSTLISLNLSQKDIADRLGHSVEMVNDTYGHLFEERRDSILDKLNSL